ncbi:protein EIN4-like [Telopea speciosissima]|uniref:protein EIN4-like n=1 Tax=Telopea speciosissima TaxID=54955 RepID=UPI001CC70F09|nr:protein EIN4-like [Telopea speciosissima]
MSKAVARGLLIFCLLLSVSAIDSSDPRCNCDEGGFLSVENILDWQRVSDFLIAVAYFSIPIELLYFVSCSNFPFKWVLFQFIAFIVLCGLTHLLNGWTYAPHPFQLMLALTIAKFLTALVSCATAITLITLIPLLLKVKVRELFLKKKAWELDREVGMMKKQKEASWHVRMLTQEIRKSLDRHTILYTTLVELSKTLDLQNCAVWMPNDNKTEMHLTHELEGSSNSYRNSIPISDPDVQKVKESKGVKILGTDSALGIASSGGSGEPGVVAAIRMPMLKVSNFNFKGGTPELIKQCYAILVLVLRNTPARGWSCHELEIVEVVADQVAVALSHAAVLEESQLMREKLEERNRALQLAEKNAMMASRARNSFQKVMSHGMRRPMHSILGLLSVIQFENMSSEQKIIVEAMMKTSSFLSTLINDVMEISNLDKGRFPLEMKSFQLHSMVKEAACLAKCLCVCKGLDFRIEVDNSVPNWVLGDERRIFQVILHMFGNLLDGCYGGESVTFRVLSEIGNEGSNEKQWAIRRPNSSDEYASIKFDIGIDNGCSQSEVSVSMMQLARRHISEGIEGGLSFSMCKKLVQMMQGNIRVLPNTQGVAQSMTLILKFLRQPPVGRGVFELRGSSEHIFSEFRGLQVVLVDNDDINRAVTRKLLEKLGCSVSAVSSGFECLSALGPSGTRIQIVILELHMLEMDGFEVATRIRKFRSWSWPLIVALTASADVDLWERCLQVGMNGVIRKPVMLQEIADELRNVLQRATKVV